MNSCTTCTGGMETAFQSVKPDFPGIVCLSDQLVFSLPKGHQGGLNIIINPSRLASAVSSLVGWRKEEEQLHTLKHLRMQTQE